MANRGCSPRRLAALAVAGCGGGGGDGAAKPTATPSSGTISSAADAPHDDAGDVGALLRERATRLERGTRRWRARRPVRSRPATGALPVAAGRSSLEQVRFVADELQTSGDRAKADVTLSYRVRGMKRPFRTPRARHRAPAPATAGA